VARWTTAPGMRVARGASAAIQVPERAQPATSAGRRNHLFDTPATATTMPASLIAAITPMVDPQVSVPLVGAFEVALGAGLLVGRWLPVVLAGVALQLSGTFLVLLLRPEVAFVEGNPLLLSVEGEYVVKNLVLLAATAALALHTLSPRPDGTTTRQFPDAHDPDHKTPTRHAA
jgi:putative oxidoreductase